MATDVTRGAYLTDVQLMTTGYGFGISGDRMVTAKTWLVYEDEQKAQAAREMMQQVLAGASVEAVG